MSLIYPASVLTIVLCYIHVLGTNQSKCEKKYFNKVKYLNKCHSTAHMMRYMTVSQPCQHCLFDNLWLISVSSGLHDTMATKLRLTKLLDHRYMIYWHKMFHRVLIVLGLVPWPIQANKANSGDKDTMETWFQKTHIFPIKIQFHTICSLHLLSLCGHMCVYVWLITDLAVVEMARSCTHTVDNEHTYKHTYTHTDSALEEHWFLLFN